MVSLSFQINIRGITPVFLGLERLVISRIIKQICKISRIIKQIYLSFRAAFTGL